MFDLYDALRRNRSGAARWFVFWLGGMGILMLLPKDSQPAATSRFVYLVLFGIVATLGFVGFFRALRRWSEARLALRYEDAPRAIRAALRYRLDERQAARAGILPATGLGLAAFFAWLASHWPQAGVLRAWQTGFAILAGASFGVALLAPLWHRTNWINGFWLRAYLKQQERYSALRPMTARAAKRIVAALGGPAVRRVGDAAEAGGFAWTFEDFKKSTLVLGQPGAGKTNAVLAGLLEALFLTFLHQGGTFSALIQDVKGDFNDKIERLCRTHGWSDRVVTFNLLADPATIGTERAIVFNPLDTTTPALEVATSIVEVFRHLGLKANDNFFLDSTRAAIVHFLTLLRAGLTDDVAPSAAHLLRLAVELSQARREPQSDENGTETDPGHEWTFFDDLGTGIGLRWPNRSHVPDAVVDAFSYIFGEYRPMASRQRDGIIGTLRQITFELTSEPLCRVMSGRTTISADDMVDQNKIVYVHAPLAEHPRQAQIANLILKMAIQNVIRRRRLKAAPSLYICDEYHNLFTPGLGGDAQFFSLCRESNHANIVAAQNLPLFYQTTTNKAEVNSFLGVCALKIFLRNTEPETNEYASKLFGEIATITVSPGESAQFGKTFRRNHTHYSRSVTTAPALSREIFTTLAVPTPERPYSQSIVHMATRSETARLTLYWKVHLL